MFDGLSTVRRHAKTTDFDGSIFGRDGGMAEMMKALFSTILDGCSTVRRMVTTDQPSVEHPS